MKPLLKIFIGLVLVIVVILAAGGVLLSVFVDPNDYRDKIKTIALDKAGIELDIKGDIGWSVFPWLGIKLNDVAVKYPDRPELAQLKQAEVSVKLLPLLSSHIEADSINVDGLKLNLIQAGQANNWTAARKNLEQSAAEAEAATKQADTSTSEAPSNASAPAFAIDIASVNITDAQLYYIDDTSKQRIEISGLNLSTGQISAGTPVPVQLSGHLKQIQDGTTQVEADLRLTTTADIDLANGVYALQDLQGQVDTRLAALGNKPLSANLSSNIRVDTQNQKAALEALNLALPQLTIKGDLQVTDFAKPVINGDLNIPAFDLKKLLGELNIAAPATTDADALRSVALEAKLSGPAGTVALNPLTIKLDKTTFKGQASVNLDTMAQNVVLAGDQINADSYMPPAAGDSNKGTSASKGTATSTASTSGWSDEEIIPLAPLQALNLDASLTLNKLTIENSTLSNVALAVSGHNSVVNVSKLNADLFSGSTRNSITLDARKAPLKTTVNSTLSNIEMGDLLKTFADNDQLTGRFNNKANLTLRGQSMKAMINSLNGTMNFNAKDGVLKGISIAQTVCQGVNNLQSLGVNAQQVDKSTPFANLTGSLRFTNGVIANNDLKATVDAMTVKGKGDIDLPKQGLDYTVSLTLEKNLFNDTCSVNNRLEGVEVPVRCKGSFSTEPAKLCKLDTRFLEDIIKNKAKEELKSKVGSKLEDKLKEKLGDEGAKSLLKGFLN